MEGLKIHLSLVLISIVNYVSSGGGPPPCEYEILGLDDSITVNSSLDIGEIVYTLTIQETAGPSPERRKRGEPAGYIAQEHDIILDNESTQFALVFSQADGYHEVRVRTCPVAGQTEILELVFNETLDDGACDIARLTIDVDPTTPEFDMGNTDNIIVDVNTCTTGVTLDVLSLEFDNNADCLSVSCLVNDLNDVKVFWTDAGTDIKASSDDIDFSKTYELLLTCFDSGAPSPSSSQTILEVSFNQTVSCTSAATTTTSGSIVLETTTQGFFDTPANVAVVAALSAVVVGAGAGVGVYLLVTRYCSTKINPAAGRKRETAVE